LIRVVGGTARGRKLFGPKGLVFRPTTGRVKEFLFSYLYEKVENAIILDLFSGSGSLGIEAISRGAKKVFFIDHSKYSITLLKKNLATCGFHKQAVILKGSVFSIIRDQKLPTFQIIFADPPFKGYYRERITENIGRYQLLSSGGLLLIEHEQHDTDSRSHSMMLIKQKRFGNSMVSIYKRISDENSNLSGDI
jgi:16S rRNA (guanine(966)-N(2))-methyltransferase RsmD